jgi:hypothetical protein
MKIKTSKEKNWKNNLLKAEQFQETARDALGKRNWNAVGLNAVHAAISACDSITVYYKKIRSASDKHSDAVNLFLEVLENSSEAKRASKHLAWLINRKNLIEYESRLFYQKEAGESLKHMERFVSWVFTKLN